MKTLILTAGLPGIGKSYAAKLIKSLLSTHKVYYFDSDLFAKTKSMKEIDYSCLSRSEVLKLRINSQKMKIEEILRLFNKHDIIILDTCFDIPEARKLYFNLEDQGINLIIIELVCSEETALSRIKKAVDYKRMPGSTKERLKEYFDMKASWKKINHKNHIIINSEEELETQLKSSLVKLLF